jgi:hypothetical protein
MKNELIEKRIVDALQKQEPLPPDKHELGGGYYYTCYWLSCRNTVTRYQNYCDQCGQKIDWGEKQ